VAAWICFGFCRGDVSFFWAVAGAHGFRYFPKKATVMLVLDVEGRGANLFEQFGPEISAPVWTRKELLVLQVIQ
jgi:hypothetical protein